MALIGCCLVYLHFLCDILSSHPVHLSVLLDFEGKFSLPHKYEMGGGKKEDKACPLKCCQHACLVIITGICGERERFSNVVVWVGGHEMGPPKCKYPSPPLPLSSPQSGSMSHSHTIRVVEAQGTIHILCPQRGALKPDTVREVAWILW